MNTNRHAWVLGATGQIGRAAVTALLGDGWRVTAVSLGGGRDAAWPDDVRTVALDRDVDGALSAALGDDCDVLVDMVGFDGAHARQLTALTGRIGSAVVVSSGAVYTDAEGRGFDTAGEPGGAPHYPVPIPEAWTTIEPGESTYAARKILLERELLSAGEALPVTVLRAGAVHGPGSRAPRELYFVKRLLDGRRRRVLAYGGRSVFHPAHTSNVAELIRLAALRPGSRVLNAADPEAPTVAEIGELIDAVLGLETETLLLPGPPGADHVGDTPWTIPHPVVYGMAAAERELGYRPVTTYADALPGSVEWLSSRLSGREWADAFPKMLQQYGPALFDYAAEDALLERHDMR
ncbi:NAD(P)-dependent oxidoreductase [Streptomyces sp. NBC_00102]|uniref:NAD-dependent epimerase/dehydratase family protein n=1 Tax=Streptomyces sp. NBC_00102 TaxID=2975652 RepID=UPI0022585EC2|nr:NAD-dependent epimerase/dehydratase family protein [Streptomyces sp. NBC_00102]MCX5395423.1 NAD-dependent epimerase/dehydratase family protein [Streptomyces sp. NBC_00102]